MSTGTQASGELRLPPGAHIPALDGLRATAILLVIIIHTIALTTNTVPDRIYRSVISVGWSGVDLFFVLSGFLITRILYDAKGSKGYFRNFYARRALRIFPLYYGFLFIYLGVLPHLAHGPIKVPPEYTQYAGYIAFYLTNFAEVFIARFSRIYNADIAVFWSLAVEEQFYLVWPFVVWVLGRRALMRVCVAAAMFAFVLRTGLLLGGSGWMAPYFLTPARLDPLAAGAFLALLLRGPVDGARLATGARRAALASGLVLLGIVLGRGDLNLSAPLVQTLGYTLVTIFFGSCLLALVLAQPTSRAARGFSHPALRLIGRHSYAMYVVHCAVIVHTRAWFRDQSRFPLLWESQLPAQALFTLFVFATSLGLAWLAWHLLEKRCLSLKRFFETEPAAPASVQAVDQAEVAAPLRPELGFRQVARFPDGVEPATAQVGVDRAAPRLR